jgi:hypothetical protein
VAISLQEMRQVNAEFGDFYVGKILAREATVAV